jgi:hypothetical protein
MLNRLTLTAARGSFERVMPIISLAALTLIVGMALFQSASAWLAGAEAKSIVPVFEAPIAQAGKALGKSADRLDADLDRAYPVRTAGREIYRGVHDL